MIYYIITYLVQSTLMMAVFYAFYKAFLYRNTFFILNRYFLLGTAIISVLAPLITSLCWLDGWVSSAESG